MTQPRRQRTRPPMDLGNLVLICLVACLAPGTCGSVQTRRGWCSSRSCRMFRLGLWTARSSPSSRCRNHCLDRRGSAERGMGVPLLLPRVGGRGRATSSLDLRVRLGVHGRVGPAQLPRDPRRARHRAGASRRQGTDRRGRPSRTHFVMLFAVMVSTVFAVLQKDTAREQVRSPRR